MRDRCFWSASPAVRWHLKFAPLVFLVLPAFLFAQTPKDIRSGGYAPASHSSAAIRVLDWNIHRGVSLSAIERTIAAASPDLCLFQEVDLNAARSDRIDVADELARRLHLNFVFARAFQELGQGTPDSPAWQGQATLSAFHIRNPRAIRYRRQTSFWAPQPWLPNGVSLLQRRAGGRIALVAEIEAGGRTLVVYNLHLESRGPGRARWLQLEETMADARRYGPDTPILLAGDLNTKYAISRFTSLLERNGFHDCFDGRSGKTHRLIGHLDWIFVRGPVGCSAAKVLRDARGSDHFPLTAVLQLR
jgi:endonuclease/exonuclease/phosphatase family metal-dependent hydrolase